MDLYFYSSKILAPLLSPINFLFIFSLISFFFYKKKIFKKILFFCFLLIFFIGFFPLGSFFLKYLEKDFYTQKDFKNLDIIVVLGGAENVFDTMKFNKLHLHQSSERLTALVKLGNDYKNAKLIYLGGKPYLNNKEILSETEVAKLYFKDIKFDLNRIIFLENSRNTIENLISLKNYLKNQNYNKMLLITSAFHMQRSLLVAKKLKLEFTPYAVDFRSGSDFFISNYWQKLSVSNNFINFDLFIRELIGSLVVKLII